MAAPTKLRMHAEGKELFFEANRIGPLPRHCHADSGKIRQVLVNILGNAVKFTESGNGWSPPSIEHDQGTTMFPGIVQREEDLDSIHNLEVGPDPHRKEKACSTGES